MEKTKSNLSSETTTGLNPLQDHGIAVDIKFILSRITKIKVDKRLVTQKRYTVNFVYNNHPWDPKIVAVVDRCSLFRGHLFNKSSQRDLKMVVVIKR